MAWPTVSFKMPKEELQELREFIQTTPGVSQSVLIRNAIKTHMMEFSPESSKETNQSTRLFEVVTELFRKEFFWDKCE